MTDIETALQDAGANWAHHRQAERAAAEQTKIFIIKAKLANIPETRIAILAGVDRMTVRRALGKL